MNAEQRKQVEHGIEIAKAWGLTDACEGYSGEIVVRFAAPKGDGEGVKRWAGDAVEAIIELAAFCAMLYTDGGRVLDITLSADGATCVIAGEEWERAVGVGVRQ